MQRTTIGCVAFFFVSLIVYGMLTYGGIRAADSEVTFRLTEALATQGSVALSADLATYPDFGLPQGKDGKHYSVFGPGQAIVSAPLLKIALLVNKTKWYDKVPAWIPISYHVDPVATSDYFSGKTPANLQPHALRFLASFSNVLVGTACVVVFFLLVQMLTQSRLAAAYVTILFAFGSLLVPYTGTFFSEPLATLFVMLSLYCLVWKEISVDRSAAPLRQAFPLLAAGLFLGLATATHLSSILFTPFFLAYALYASCPRSRAVGRIVLAGGAFVAGLGLLLVLLGYYNFVRFGNVLETGRSVDPGAIERFGYGSFVAPWRGFSGLLLSYGKGILWYCPAAVLGIVLCGPFSKRYRFLSMMVLTAVVFRLCFIASRSDWHGGFCLGPRYLVLVVPLLLLPLGEIVAQWIRQRRAKALCAFCAFSAFCVVEAVYFCLGNVFYFYTAILHNTTAQGINIFQHDALYFEPTTSPLWYLWKAPPSPWVLKTTMIDTYTLCFYAAAVIVALLLLVYLALFPWRNQLSPTSSGGTT